MPLASTNIETDPSEARMGSPDAGAKGMSTNQGALNQLGGGGGGDLSGLLTKQIANLEETRSKKKAVIDKAIANLSTRQPESGPSAEELFRLMGAFAAPTKTGSFFETLSGVGNVGADIMKGRRESKANLNDLMTKYELQGLDIDAEHLKQTIDAQKALQTANAPASVYGKTAQDEGLKPGTPAFAARVQELAAQDLEIKKAKAQGPQAGAFDTKTGNYVAPNGTVIKAAEIAKDREGRDAIAKLQDQLKLLDPKTIKAADSFFDWTGAGATGDVGKLIGGKLFPETAKAQSKITAAALNDRLKSLPPGPASDKDIAQAKSTFPGFASAKNLQDWVDRTNQAINNYIARQDEKYGGAQWYGAGQGAPGSVLPSPSGGGTSVGQKPGAGSDDKGRSKVSGNQGGAGGLKPGAVYNGHRFKGGDPKNQSSWEPI